MLRCAAAFQLCELTCAALTTPSRHEARSRVGIYSAAWPVLRAHLKPSSANQRCRPC